MEGGGSEEEKRKEKPAEVENKIKRRMKTAFQLEVLEKTYVGEAYPSEAVRAELSAKLGLSDRQLQMWFCHRRLKDRKSAPTAKKPRNDHPPVAPDSVPEGEGLEQMAVADAMHDCGLASGLKPFGYSDPRRVVPNPSISFTGRGAGLPTMENNSYYEPHQAIEVLRAITFVERQLGQPLREDGPILGMEFDSLPPGAFGAPIEEVTLGQHRHSGSPFEAKIYDQRNKGIPRTLHEYQFIPEQLTVRNETFDRVAPTIHYSSPDGISHSRTLLPSQKSLLGGNESTPYGYGVQDQMPALNHLSQHVRQNHVLPSASGQIEGIPRKNTFVDVTVVTHSGVHPITLTDTALVPSDNTVIHEEEPSRLQRKRMNEEARIRRELEAHEKRVRKEIEKQDILRRKREEQIKKEMERNNRERRKEEERLLRERQREEERYQREQRRDLERREKLLQKESIRAEKLKQKEELRREKEAARIKAAYERALARRMTRESMGLIEDERLELMELATLKKRLPSILALDYETMQNLELYRDGQTPFPPESVQLKKPFSIQPWSDSEEKTGNLLMVWRFLNTFADVLGIWSFTLDELIQAFHDYDPRLLGEIHIALLRSIMKDIEDVARTPSTGLGGNQNNVANYGGGHPQVAEGAYVWGFDIRNWQRHLNPLTWPEILRQFALSAGFGPKLQRHSESVHPCDNNEGHDCKDIISHLRSGAAVKNAVAIMQEKGLSKPSRSRHRLTPGTVKFAAFHVLSVEGSNGLNILEVAEKIQKSGLRDLTTSKTPEASISAALSRDTKLFERIAPLTYCVRPAYRKDLSDAEAIFSAARERIRIFKSGYMDAGEAEEGGREDDSESDVAEDIETDDLGAETNIKNGGFSSVEFNSETVMRIRKDTGKVSQTLGCYDHEKLDEDILSIVSEGIDMHKGISASCDIAVCSNDVSNPNLEGMDIDESIPDESWVQGLMEGEYSDLSVEERLNALVALVNVAIEGNLIRVTLEDRLEAANALKKQMWAEAQLGKRRIKEDYFVKMHPVSNFSNRSESNSAFPSLEDKQKPFLSVDNKNDEALLTPLGRCNQINELLENPNHIESSSLEVSHQLHQSSANQDNYSLQQFGFAPEKSRSNIKSYIGYLAEQTYMYRTLPLGLDRRHNRYWQFIASASPNDPGCGRIFVELHDGCWKLIDSEKGFDSLLGSLDVRGIRESHLHMMLQSIEMAFKESIRRNVHNGDARMENGDTVKRLKTEAFEVDTNNYCSDIHHPTSVCIDNSDASEVSTSFAVQLGRNEAENRDALLRYQDFEKWMLNECLNSSILCALKFGKRRRSKLLTVCDSCHDVYFFDRIKCPSCNRTLNAHGKAKIDTDYFHVSSYLPLRMRLLKVLLSIVEVSVPEEAFHGIWTNSYRKSWCTKLDACSSTEDLLEILTVLESAIKREYLDSNYETTSELLGSRSSSGCPPTNDFVGAERILPWVPCTTAAVALRLMELDACTSYTFQQKMESEKDKRIGIVMKLPTKYASAKSSCRDSAIEERGQTSQQGQRSRQGQSMHKVKHTVENMVGLGAGLASYSRGQRSRQGRSHSCASGRSQGRVLSSRHDSRKRSTTSSSMRIGNLLGWKGRSCRHAEQNVRARRSVRSRQKPAVKVCVTGVEKDTPDDITGYTAGIFINEKMNGSEVEAAARSASSSEKLAYENDIYQSTVDAYEYLIDDNNDGYEGGFSGKSENFVEGSNHNVDDDENEDVDDNDDEDGQVDVEDYISHKSDTDAGENADQNMDPNGTDSTSSESSD
ncbi:hypothetical protein HN51_035339 [Arachis hypogaea]|uniref:homeobox-DDT domain protein RLT2 isoform X2 n=1 Tax=Arachis ipaensis TaxID=130454 RepID=UPI0007AF7AA7|nr:homeobox-DDT domain protein RLT2 isoform X2 [Arachis ipaensis]XP_025643551.1 homeobox-DDT domain protein RLT2 isoform X2 [Arachis hypogaea]QHO00372.1 uncharacterized protein DS421_13g405980 [Arachis hypogaea]